MDVTCPCGTTFQAKSARAKYCSDRCRKRSQRSGEVVPLPTTTTAAGPEPAPPMGPVLASTIKDLTDAGRLDTTLGQVCLALARRVDSPGMDTGSSFRSVVQELKVTLAEATRGTGKATAPQQLQDELAARRAAHGA